MLFVSFLSTSFSWKPKNVGLTQKDLWNFVILAKLTSCHLNIGSYLHSDFHWVFINFLPERRLTFTMQSLLLVNVNWKTVCYSFSYYFKIHQLISKYFFKKPLKGMPKNTMLRTFLSCNWEFQFHSSLSC